MHQSEPGILSVSDLHIGQWERNPVYCVTDKTRALAAMMRLAGEQHVRAVRMIGDTVDNRVTDEQIEEEMAALRTAMLELPLEIPLEIQRGNHDRALTRERAEELIGRPCHWLDTIVMDDSRYVTTHADIFDIKLARSIIHSLPDSLPAPFIADLFDRHPALLSALQKLDKRYLRWDAFHDKHPKIRILQEHAWGVSGKTRPMLSTLLQAVVPPDPFIGRRLKQVAASFDLHHVKHAASLAERLGGNRIVIGHTHQVGIYRRRVRGHEILVGNSGSFIQSRQGLYCIVTEADRMTLFRYHRRKDAMIPCKIRELTMHSVSKELVIA